MDAISVVLGVNSAQLRSGQLKDLVYRGQRLAKNEIKDASEPGEDGGEMTTRAREREGRGEEGLGACGLRRCKQEEAEFPAEVRVLPPSYTAYSITLTSHNISVKAPNFLIFQGDVEAVASQSPYRTFETRRSDQWVTRTQNGVRRVRGVDGECDGEGDGEFWKETWYYRRD